MVDWVVGVGFVFKRSLFDMFDVVVDCALSCLCFCLHVLFVCDVLDGLPVAFLGLL